MAAAKTTTKTFAAVLERMPGNLGWVIARVPFSVASVWGKRGQIRVDGEINGFSFNTSLFPTKSGEHFVLVNKKMQSGAKTAPGLKAKFRLTPDISLRPRYEQPEELQRELRQSKKLLKFYEALSASRKNDIARWIVEAKQAESRQRRAQQIAERLFETMEAERELPPLMQLAFRQNPRASEGWERITPTARRHYLFAIFHYRDPESRARRITKVMEELAGRVEKKLRRSQEEIDL